MRASTFRVTDEHDSDCFARCDDYESALLAARDASRERPDDTILVSYRGWVVRHVRRTPDGVAEEEVTSPEAVDRAIAASAPSFAAARTA